MSESKEIRLINFSKEERNDIAEFVYSYNSDILIKSDAIKVLDTLKKHNLIDNYEVLSEEVRSQKYGIAEKILIILGEKINESQGKAIMHEYYSNASQYFS